MKRFTQLLSMLLIGSIAFVGCEQPEVTPLINESVPDDVLIRLQELGFNVTDRAPVRFESGYLVEGDIYLPESELAIMTTGVRIPFAEQYSTNNLVTGAPRSISIYIPVGGRKGFSSAYSSAIDEVISRYNDERLNLSFTRVSSSGAADIVITRLNKGYERQGYLGSAGFPSSGGDPYGNIRLSGILESVYGLGVNGIATIIAHEVGHCIGFRHTDYFDRSISCGGSPANEGDGGIGANHIPGTPTGATLADKSWMLSCTDGGDRPFNRDDQVALDYLY
ncbi:MAG TPA: M57 family metalloprotease [Cyclobacteriaceae bacterium]